MEYTLLTMLHKWRRKMQRAFIYKSISVRGTNLAYEMLIIETLTLFRDHSKLHDLDNCKNTIQIFCLFQLIFVYSIPSEPHFLFNIMFPQRMYLYFG